MRPPDHLPDLDVVTDDGQAVGLSDFDGGPLVLTFVRPYADPRSTLARQLIDRLARTRGVLRTDIADRTTFLVLLLDDPGNTPPPAWLPRGRDWEIAVGPQEPIRELAGRLGVLLWDSTEDLPGQTFVTVVVDAAGRVRARLLGLEPWSVNDLVGTIVTVD